MITSELFIRIASTLYSSSSSSSSFSTLLFETLLTSLSFSSTIRNCAFSEPNYGSSWFTIKNQPLANAESVIQKSVKHVAHHVAENADLYYEAMRMTALREKEKRNIFDQHLKDCISELSNPGMAENKQRGIHFPAIPTDRCAFAISPLPIGRRDHNKTMGELLQLLFATSQIEG